MIKILDKNFDSQKFNALAEYPMQAWEWGEFRQELGIEVVRFGEFTSRDSNQEDKNSEKNLELKKVYQISFHKFPKTSKKIGYVPRSSFPSEEFLDFLKKYGRENKVIFYKFEPNTFAGKNLQIIKKYKLHKSFHEYLTKWQFLLDLRPTEEELFKNLKSKTRYNVRLAGKKGVEVKLVNTDEGFEDFLRLYLQTTKRQQYHGRSEKYLRAVWKHLQGKMAHILIAYYQESPDSKPVPLAAYILFLFNDVLYYPYGGSSGKYRKLMAANLLMWEAIAFGKKQGAKLFDMWGSLPPDYDKNDPRAGFTRFKEGFGGHAVEYLGTYDFVLDSKWYFLYRLGYHARKISWWLKANFYGIIRKLRKK